MQPLQHITLVEANRPKGPIHLRLAASLAAKIAADLGARVIKIEPPGGDPVRRLPPFLRNGTVTESALFQFLNTGKESVVLDIEAEDGGAVYSRIAAKVDAVIVEDAPIDEPLPTGPVIVNISAFGRQSSYCGTPTSELTLLALGGLLHIIGAPDRAPLRLGGHQASYAAGLAAFTGLMSGLAARENGMPGQLIDVSLLDAILWVNWKVPVGTLMLDNAPKRHGDDAEWLTIPCADGHVALVYMERDWKPICDLVGDPVLAGVTFANRAGRRQNHSEMISRIGAWFSRRSRREIYDEAKKRGIPLGPVWSPTELLNDPHYAARDFIDRQRHPTLNELRIPKLPLLWNGKGFSPRPAPTLGAHRDMPA